MKVTKVEVFLAGAVWRNFILVKLTTDSGLVGWGEGTLGWKETSVREMILIWVGDTSLVKAPLISKPSGSRFTRLSTTRGRLCLPPWRGLRTPCGTWSARRAISPFTTWWAGKSGQK